MIQIKLKKDLSGNKFNYFIVVKDWKKASSKGFLEKIGSYTPYTDNLNNRYIFINSTRFSFWIKKGAVINKNLYGLIHNFSCFYEN